MKLLTPVDALPGLAELIVRRHELGQDGYDEVWDGEYHVNAMAHSDHGDVQAQLMAQLRHLARGLVVSGPVNIGMDEHNFRVPDAVVLRERANRVWVPTAAIVVEVRSPGDDTYVKFDFYRERGVDEILVADLDTRILQLFGRAVDEVGTISFVPVETSAVLHVNISEIAIDWP